VVHLWATSGPRPLVTRPAKLFVNLLLVATSSFIFFTPKNLKENHDSYLICYFMHKCHTCYWLKPCCKMQVFQVKLVSDRSCCRSKFKTIFNSVVICAHFNKIYIWAYNIVICHFWISVVKGKENWLLVLRTVPGGVSWPLGNRKTILGLRKEKKLDHPVIYSNTV
jgi:hypothetical protein